MITYLGNRNQLSKWDLRFLELAEHVASWSKGPRKRVGAVITRPDHSIASMGYNGPPRGYNDEAFLRMTREEQHEVVIHAEDNALFQMPFSEFGRCFDIYVSPLYPCEQCALKIVGDRRIRRVVAYCGHISSDWLQSAREARDIFISNGVECIFVSDGVTDGPF